jgi:hypothetical protein
VPAESQLLWNSSRPFTTITPVQFDRYFKAAPGAHGSGGPIDVSVPADWEPGVEKFFEIIEDDGVGVVSW